MNEHLGKMRADVLAIVGKPEACKRYWVYDGGLVWDSLRGHKTHVRSHQDDYYEVVLGINPGTTKYIRLAQRVHRLVAYFYVAGYEPGLVVDHIDGNRNNNHSSNLRWVTPAENISFSYAGGKRKGQQSGEKNNTAKVTELEVRSLMAYWHPEIPVKSWHQKAAELGVNISHKGLNNIAFGYNWVSVTKEYGLVPTEAAIRTILERGDKKRAKRAKLREAACKH